MSFDLQQVADAHANASDIQRDRIESHLRAAGLVAGCFGDLIAAAQAANVALPDVYVTEKSGWTYLGFDFDASPLKIRSWCITHAPHLIDASATNAWPFQVSDWQPGLDAAAAAATP